MAAIFDFRIAGKQVDENTFEVSVGKSKMLLRRKSGSTVEAGEAGGDREASRESTTETRRWRYVHRGTCSDGPCARCAVWIGHEFDWDGETTIVTTINGFDVKTTPDGVPVENQHPYCDCFVVPVDGDQILPDDDGGSDRFRERFEYLNSLSNTELRGILGDVRARLIREGLATVEMFYDEHYDLVPLHRLGYSTAGNPIDMNGKPRRSRELLFF